MMLENTVENKTENLEIRKKLPPQALTGMADTILPPQAVPLPLAGTANNENKIVFDEKLKEEILEIAHRDEKNFVIFCGLFDSKPYTEGKNLILDFSSLYCYEFFRQERNGIKLTEIFNNYSNVIIKFEAISLTCPTFSPQTVPLPLAGTADNENKIDFDEKLKKPEKTEKPSSFTSFNNFIHELAALKTKPEIILIKHNEIENENDDEESENNNLENNLESESEQEGDFE